ncbi:hypothetical protein B566_EDAN017281 [Ephemera danica]|nr:hypothetical protein B566_EDAN017281 [Ephemera danica]
MSVKNKFCYVCSVAARKEKEPGEHTCYRNYPVDQSAGSMESAIIAEGFCNSMDMYGLKYGRLIGDGDCSVHKKILELNPYCNIQVEKLECTNHLLRNYCQKLREVPKDRAFLKVDKKLKNKLNTETITRLRNAVTCAVKARKNENSSVREQISKKDQEVNIVSDLQRAGIFQRIQTCTHAIACMSRSLLEEVTSNIVEQVFSLVAKYGCGKRINIGQSYSARCSAAITTHNTSGNLNTLLHKKMCNTSPGFHAKIAESRQKRKIQRASARRLEINSMTEEATSSKRKKLYETRSGTSKTYMPNAPQAQMSTEDFDLARDEFLKNLNRTDEQRHELERATIDQADSGLWKEERRKFLTASNFGDVCIRRPHTPCHGLLVNFLCTIPDNVAMRYGRENESIAISFLETATGQKISRCGATPDGLTEDGGIVEQIKVLFYSF